MLNSDTAYFEKAGEGGRWSCNQPVMDGFDANTIVRYQTRKDEQAARCRVKKVKHKPRFAGAGGTANEDSLCAGQDR